MLPSPIRSRGDPAHAGQHRADEAVVGVDVLLELDADPLADRQLDVRVVAVPALAFHVGDQHDPERVDARQHEPRLARRGAAVELQDPMLEQLASPSSAKHSRRRREDGIGVSAAAVVVAPVHWSERATGGRIPVAASGVPSRTLAAC